MRLAAILLAVCAISTFADARTNRDHKAIAAFKRANPCPSTGKPRGACPGWVVDHVTALACGGADDPSNMQWQTTEAAKEKDKWERNGCTVTSRRTTPISAKQ